MVTGTGNKDKRSRDYECHQRKSMLCGKQGRARWLFLYCFKYLAWSSLKLYLHVHSKGDPWEHPNPSSLAPSTLMASTSTVPLLALLANPGLSVPITTPTSDSHVQAFLCPQPLIFPGFLLTVQVYPTILLPLHSVCPFQFLQMFLPSLSKHLIWGQ